VGKLWFIPLAKKIINNIGQGWPTRPMKRLVAACQLVDHTWFCRIDKIPKKNTFQSKFQKVHKNYPSIGWSRIFFGASCNDWP